LRWFGFGIGKGGDEMRRTSRKDEICFENLEEALGKNPETYGHLFLLCAGWSCQNNSICGNREGLQGAESRVWKEVARVLRLFKPRWFIGENVPGLLSVNEGKDFQEILSDLMEIGYGVSWRVLDSQYFGVAQRRRRIFFIGYFGRSCPPEILFEQKSNKRNNKKMLEKSPNAKCLMSKQDKWNPTTEDYIFSTIIGTEKGNRLHGYIASTLGSGKRGIDSQTDYIAEINPKRKGSTSRIPKGLDTNRGVVLGNAVTVNVAEWIGKRIIKYEAGLL